MESVKRYSRRDFLKTSGGTIAVISLSGLDRLRASTTGDIQPSDDPSSLAAYWPIPSGVVDEEFRVPYGFGARHSVSKDLPRTMQFRVQSATDLVDLNFVWTNMAFVEGDRGPAIVRQRGVKASLAVTFPGQYVLEGELAGLSAAEGKVHAMLCAPSQIVFAVNDDKVRPFDIKHFLDWGDFDLSVVPNAQPPEADEDPPALRAPILDRETSIVLPWGMVLSPSKYQTWTNSGEPAAPSSIKGRRRVELWHATLARGRGIKDPDLSVRSVWMGWKAPMDKSLVAFPCVKSREAIMRETSDFTLTVDGKTVAKPMVVSRMMLSSQGAYAKVRVKWDKKDIHGLGSIRSVDPDPRDVLKNFVLNDIPLDVDEVIEEIVWGREQYIRVSRLGYGLPFGHVISWICIRRREFADDPVIVAGLREHSYCSVRTPSVAYSFPANGSAVPGREFCFGEVELSPVQTPFLTQNCNPDFSWMFLESDPKAIFSFQVSATDREGRKCKFSMPLLWVGKNDAELGNNLDAVLDEYCKQPERRRADLNGQKISLIPQDELTTGSKPSQGPDRSVSVSSIRFKVNEDGANPKNWQSGNSPARVPGGPVLKFPDWREWGIMFYPALEEADAQLHQTAAFDTNGARDMAKVSYHELYVVHGLGNSVGNGNQVYAKVAGATMSFPPAVAASLATPSVDIANLSAIFGPVGGGMDKQSGGSAVNAEADFNPSSFFNGAAQLIGGVDLAQVVQPITDAYNRIASVPQLISSTLAELSGAASEIQSDMDEINVALNLIRNPSGALADLKGEFAAQATAVLNQQALGAFDGIVDGSQAASNKLIATLQNGVNSVARQLYPGTAPRDVRIRNAISDAATAVEVSALVSVIWWDSTTRLKGALKQAIAERAADLASNEVDALFEAAGGLGPISQYIDDTVNGFASIVRMEVVGLGALRQNILSEIRLAGAASNDWMALGQSFSFVDVGTIVKGWTDGIRGAVAQFQLLPLNELSDLAASFEELRNSSDSPAKLLPNLPRILDSLQSELDRLSTNADPSGLVAEELNQLRQARTNLLSAIGPDSQKASPLFPFEPALRGKLDELGANVSKALDSTLAAVPPEHSAELSSAIASAKNRLQMYIGPLGDFQLRIRTNASSVSTQVSSLVSALDPDSDKIKAGYQNVGSQLQTGIQKAQNVVAGMRKIDQAIESLPQQLAISYSWQPPLQSAGPFIASSSSGRTAAFDITVDIKETIGLLTPPSPPATRMDAKLKDFRLRLLPSTPFLTISFQEVSFLSVNGAAPNVTVKIEDVEFGEALSFVADLAKTLSQGTHIDIGLIEGGIQAGYAFPIPDIEAGGFSMFDLSIGCSVILPLTGGPVKARFSLSERDSPFFLTAGVYGGGGFFAITALPTGVEKLEGSLEFGGVVAVDLGVASGRVSVTGGVYFSAEGGDASLFGFTRAVGTLEVISLISICAEFYLSLGYERRGGQSYAVGEAILTVEIDMVLSHISVDVHFRKEYQGSSSGGGSGSAASGIEAGGSLWALAGHDGNCDESYDDVAKYDEQKNRLDWKLIDERRLCAL